MFHFREEIREKKSKETRLLKRKPKGKLGRNKTPDRHCGIIVKCIADCERVTQARSGKSKLRAGCINKEPGGHSLITAQLIRQKFFVWLPAPWSPESHGGAQGFSGKGLGNDRKVPEAQCLAVWVFTRFSEAGFAVLPSAPHMLFLLPGSTLPALSSPFLDYSKATASPSFLQDSVPRPYPIPPSPLSRHPSIASLVLAPHRLEAQRLRIKSV